MVISACEKNTTIKLDYRHKCESKRDINVLFSSQYWEEAKNGSKLILVVLLLIRIRYLSVSTMLDPFTTSTAYSIFTKFSWNRVKKRCTNHSNSFFSLAKWQLTSTSFFLAQMLTSGNGGKQIIIQVSGYAIKY